MKNQKTLDKVLSIINHSTKGEYLSFKIEDILKEDKLNISFIVKNFDYLIMLVDENNFARLLNYVSLEENLSRSVLKKFSSFMRRFKTGDISNKNQEIFFDMITFLPGNKTVLLKNMKDVIESISPTVLFDLAFSLKEISPKYSNKINETINSNQDKICKDILLRSLSKRNVQDDITIKDLNDYSLTLQILFREILKSEGKKFCDVEMIGEGGFSQIFKVGDKVIKVGAPRKTYNIPNHRRIIQPLARVNLTNQYQESIGTIEVTDEVDTSRGALSKITKEDLYRIYKELRDDGIIWTDPKINNLGILKRKNVPTIRGKHFQVSPISAGFINELKEIKPLNKGDIVIVDTDYLYLQGQKDISYNNNPYIDYFEKRYQEEKRKKGKDSTEKKIFTQEKDIDDDLDY